MTYAVAVYNSTKERWLEVMDWTTEPPTKPGWYWVMTGDSYYPPNGKPYPMTVKFVKKDWVEVPGYDIASEVSFTHWLGPLPEPEPPKETIDIT